MVTYNFKSKIQIFHNKTNINLFWRLFSKVRNQFCIKQFIEGVDSNI
jgi:hypothetical protein